MLRIEELVRSLLHSYKVWLIHRRTRKLIAQIDELTGQINKAKKQKRGHRALEMQRRRLGTQRLVIEQKIFRLF